LSGNIKLQIKTLSPASKLIRNKWHQGNVSAEINKTSFQMVVNSA